MRKKMLFISLLISALSVQAVVTLDTLPYSNSLKKKIEKSEIFVKSKVETLKSEKKQSFVFESAALHSRSCRYALRKLSLYENYEDYLDFIAKSSYDDSKEVLKFLLSTPILPIKMTLMFKFPRVKKPGVYTYQFDKGFLAGLKGEVHVSERNKRCFFYGKANWKGPDTGYSDTLFEFFSSTLAKLAVKNLFRISKTY